MRTKPFPSRPDIAAALADAGLTQVEVASRIRRTQPYISHVIAGRLPVSAALAESLSDVLGVSIEPTFREVSA